MSRNYLAREGQQLAAVETSVRSCTVAIPSNDPQENVNDGIVFSPGRSPSDGAPDTDNTHLQASNQLNSTLPPKSTEQWANVSEMTLVEFIKSGNHSAYSELFRRHSTLAFRVAYRITQNEQDAEDAMQDSLFLAFKRISSFDGRSAFTTWLTRIAINTSLMLLRKRRKYVATSLDNDEKIELQITDPAPSPELLLVRLERNATVREAVRRLPSLLRSSIETRYWKELSIQDAAAVNGVSVAAAKSRELRGRGQLRTMLERRGQNR
jgi:RNA polymerase sigma-70 factor (ECF subfamily)